MTVRVAYNNQSMLRKLISRPARLVLGRLGLEVRHKQADTGLTQLTALEDPCDAIYQHGDVAFEVPLAKCRYPFHFSYDPLGWHPFVQTLRQYQENPKLRYHDSVLHDFYSKHQPKSLLEAFFGTPTAATADLSSLAELAIPQYEPFFPWDPKKPTAKGEKGLDSAHGHQGFGPVTDDKGELELLRLTQTYDSIEANGYQPSHGHDGDIRGYLLKTDGDYRFIIRQGLHRAAVLSAMNYTHIRVCFFDPYPRAIFKGELENWPQVKRGVMTREAAECIFTMFFKENGTEKARRIGLIS